MLASIASAERVVTANDALMMLISADITIAASSTGRPPRPSRDHSQEILHDKGVAQPAARRLQNSSMTLCRDADECAPITTLRRNAIH